ncbi:MAG: NAD(P)/FAD-dependent oxidoreductase [Microbacteriaceae bacterium]
MPQPILIVGAAMAGLRTAESLRKSGHTGPITIIGDEVHAPYSRPPLSKAALSTGVTHDAVAFVQRAATADVTWMLGTRVTAVDLEAHTATTGVGDVLEWSILVIATGLRSARLPGPTFAGRHSVRSLEDAQNLREQLVPEANVVVIGSGFLGCEIAATASALGCHVTVVSHSELPIIRPLGSELGAEILARHVAHGVDFRMSTGVDSLTGDDRVRGVLLDTGELLAADVVVEAIGSECNSEWLSESNLDISDGVLADSALRAVSVEGIPYDDVFVVGDIARFPNTLFGETPRRVEHWNIPTETGRRAGAVIAARLSDSVTYETVRNAEFTPMPAFWSDQFDVSLQAYGMPALADETRVLEGNLSDQAIVGYFLVGRLVGVVGLGVKAGLMPYRKIIADGGYWSDGESE